MRAPITNNIQADILFHPRLFTGVFWRLKEARKRFIICYGGAGSSKSYSMMQLSLMKILEGDGDGLVIRKYGTDIENSVYDGLRHIQDEWGLSSVFVNVYSNQKREMYCEESGKRILFKGLDDPDKIKSIFGIKWIFIEEANQLDEEDFRELNRRARGMQGVQIFMLFNPINPNNWIKKYFFDVDIFRDKTIVIHSTFEDNPFLTEDDKDELRRLQFVNENDYNVYALGRWGSIRTGQEFYSAFKYSEHVSKRVFIPNVAIHISFDQNVVPYITMTISQIYRKDEMWIISMLEEICLSNPRNSTEELCREFLNRYEKKLGGGLFYYGDASGRNRDTRGRENDYDIVERVLGRYLHSSSNRVPSSNPPVIKRREFINRLLANQFPIRLRVDPDCKNMISDFELVKEDADGRKFKSKKKDRTTGITFEEVGHTSDTLDYLIMAAFDDYINF